MATTSESTELQQAADEAQLVLPDDAIIEVVDGIREAQKKHGFALVQEVGRLIVEKFYGGDVSVLRDRSKTDGSLRQLAEHPDLPMSASSLYRAVAMHELIERHGGVAGWKHLGPSHVRAVLPLEEKVQKRILRYAENHSWTVDRIEEAVRKARDGEERHGGGRPPLPKFQKSINALRKYADNADDLFSELDKLDGIDEKKAREMYTTVCGLRAKLEELEAQLEAKVQGG